MFGLNSISRKITEAYKSSVTRLQDLAAQVGRNGADEIVGGHLLGFDAASGSLELRNIVTRRQALNVALVKLLSNAKKVIVQLFGFAPFDSL